jgi:hypothetical protein
LYSSNEERKDEKFRNMLSDFRAIIRRGKKSNTYKFVLARSILEFVKNNESEIKKNIDNNRVTIINYSTFADYFLKFYWRQQKSKIPQNHNTDSIPSAVQTLKELFDKHPQPEKFDMVSEELKIHARKKILQGVFGTGSKSQVIPKFQTIPVGKKSMKKENFYKNEPDNKQIIINPDSMQFFIHYRDLLDSFVILELAKFLDKIKPSPGIVSKIEEPDFDRTTLKTHERLLNKYFKNCFYCNEDLDGLTIHVDHFIPFSYIFENKYWNLVLSCSKCNLNKSDSLAKDFKMELIARNNQFRHDLDRQNKDFKTVDKDFKKLDEGNWETEFERIYRNCQEYGFSEIKKSEILKRK